MDLRTIEAIIPELESELSGRRLGKLFQLSRLELAIDFRLPDSRYLLVSVEPTNPRLYLIRRRLRDLEKSSLNLTAFSQLIRGKLSGATLIAIKQLEGERVVSLEFQTFDELEREGRFSLISQLTGKSANLFLVDSQGMILGSARDTSGKGQQEGDQYAPPEKRSGETGHESPSELAAVNGSLSEALDELHQKDNEAKRRRTLEATARSRIRREISKREKLLGKLRDDLERHGEADSWKRLGDLLLANVATARRDGDKVFVTDYFDDSAPEISIDTDPQDSLSEAAEKFFKRYTKARNARDEIRNRTETIESELRDLRLASDDLENAIEQGDESYLKKAAGVVPATKETTGRKKKEPAPSGVRNFISSDGFDILVGKKSTDNDFLTFRIAKSLDTWMHAADYPGSHVVVRNPNRKEIPQRTLLEAAQLAAFYSQGKNQTKAAVHYTLKKFVNKPRGAAPGLVSLASFKTLLVEPIIGDAKLKVA